MEITALPIYDVRLIRDKLTSTSRGFCFVELGSVEVMIDVNLFCLHYSNGSKVHTASKYCIKSRQHYTTVLITSDSFSPIINL